ncbi:hypothetical protein [Paenibacillus terrae]
MRNETDLGVLSILDPACLPHKINITEKIY